MTNIIGEHLKSYKKQIQNKKKLLMGFFLLSLIVALAVAWALKLTGISLTGEPGLGEGKNVVAGEDINVVDRESAADWEASLPDLSHVPETDIVNVAKSQLGYTESEKNFVLDSDGVTHKGYTRYGEWYGSPYGDWSAMFVSFCLNYANIPEQVIPRNSGVFAFLSALENTEYFVPANDVPQAGYLVFFADEGHKNANRIGIVSAVDKDKSVMTAIEGDYDKKVAENEVVFGDSAAVGFVNVSAAYADALEKGVINDCGIYIEDWPPELFGLLEEFDISVKETLVPVRASYEDGKTDIRAVRNAKENIDTVYNKALSLYLKTAAGPTEEDFKNDMREMQRENWSVWIWAEELLESELSKPEEPALSEPVAGKKDFTAVYDDNGISLSFSLEGEICFPQEDGASPSATVRDKLSSEKTLQTAEVENDRWSDINLDVVPSEDSVYKEFSEYIHKEAGCLYNMTALDIIFTYADFPLDISSCTLDAEILIKSDMPSDKAVDAFDSLSVIVCQRSPDGEISVLERSALTAPVEGIIGKIKTSPALGNSVAVAVYGPEFTEPLSGEKLFRVYEGDRFTVDFSLSGDIAFPKKTETNEYWENINISTEAPGEEAREALEAYAKDDEDEAAELVVLDGDFVYDGESLDISSCSLSAQVNALEPTGGEAGEEETENPVAFKAFQRTPEGEVSELKALDAAPEGDLKNSATFSPAPGSSVAVKAISVKSIADPEITVDYWGNVVVPDFSLTEDKDNGYLLPILNTDTSAGGRLPWNATIENPKYYLKTTPVSDMHQIQYKTEFLHLYKEAVFKLNTSPGVQYVNTVGGNYFLKSISVYSGAYDPETSSNGTPIATYGIFQDNNDYNYIYPDLATATFVTETSIATPENNMIYVEDGWTVRLQYSPTQNNAVSHPVRFWDYDITQGSSVAGSNYTYWPTAYFGINAAAHQANSLAQADPCFHFGNANTGVSNQELAKRNNNFINRGNRADNNLTDGLCCFAILDKYNHNLFNSGENIAGQSIAFLYDDSACSGKTEVMGYKLNFEQTGDFFNLVNYTSPEGYNSSHRLDTFAVRPVNFSANNYWVNQHANDFWPMDHVAWWRDAAHGGNIGGHDPKWGNSDKVFFGNSRYSSFPFSDDGTDHNPLFGMNYDVDFELPANYIGPLNYIFNGDDDLWVYLQRLRDDGTVIDEELICDVGGVHLTIGEYVNLRNYLPLGSCGRFRLHVMYNERGNSGSTCYMAFCLPNPGVAVTKKGEVWLDKEVNGFHNINDRFEFKFDVSGGTPAVYAGEMFPYYIYSPVYGSGGDVITSGYDVFRTGGQPSRVGTVRSGDNISLGRLEFVRVLNLPEDAYVVWTETLNSHFDVMHKWHYVQLNEHPDLNWDNPSGTNTTNTDYTYVKTEANEWVYRFVNTVKSPPVGEVWLEKAVIDEDNRIPDDAEFTFQLDIDYAGFSGGSEPEYYTCNFYDSYDAYRNGGAAVSSDSIANHSTIKLRDGCFVRVAGVPLGAKTTWTELSVEMNGQTVAMTAGDGDSWETTYKWNYVDMTGTLPEHGALSWSNLVSGLSNYGRVNEGETFFARFENACAGFSEMWLEKKVEPADLPCADEFTFTMDFSENAEGGSYPYYIYNRYDNFYNDKNDYIDSGTIADGGSIILRKDQFIRIMDLPGAQAGYKWTEIVPEGYETPINHYCRVTNYDVADIPYPQVWNGGNSMNTTSGSNDSSKLWFERFTNAKKKYSLEFEKRADNLSGSLLAGAELSLAAADGDWNALSAQPAGFPKTATAGENGIISFTELLWGNYLLTETKAPPGFRLPGAPWRVTIAADGSVTLWEKGENKTYDIIDMPVLVNHTGFELPHTGSAGILLYTFGGLLLTAVPLMYIGYIARRKRKGGEPN